MKTQVNGLTIAYDMQGPEKAPTIMLHHSLCTNRHMWDDVARSLAKRYRVVRADARGHGESEAPEGPYRFKDLTGDVTGLMDNLNIKSAHHVGLSMGGMIGQHLGLLAPRRVDSLMLVSTTSHVPEEARASWDERLRAVTDGGMETQITPTLERWFTKPFHTSGHDEVLTRIAQMIRTTPTAGFLGWGQAIRDLDITAKLKEVKAPTLVIVGEDDPGTPVAAAQAIYDEIPDAELHIFPEASHQLPLQRPSEFLDAVRDFLIDLEEEDGYAAEAEIDIPESIE